MKILTTFSGKFGDILWSLPTVKSIARVTWIENLRNGQDADTVHFGIMPQYESLLPLLNSQKYINRAFVIKEWECTGSPHGDQPWQSPSFPGRGEYEKVYDLTYRHHPGYGPNGQQLAAFIAAQQGAGLDCQPFIDVDQDEWIEVTSPYIAYAFNPSYAELKAAFLHHVKQVLHSMATKPEQCVEFVNVAEFPWKKAAAWIRNARCFIGCRSANYVIAHGVGQRVICYEPEPWRRYRTYSYPFGLECLVNLDNAANEAVDQMRFWEVV